MNDVIWGNIFSLCAQISDSVSGTRKNTKSVLGVQMISLVFYFACNIILKGYSAVVQNVVAAFRNILAMGKKKIPVIEWILTVCAVVFGIVFNNRGVIGLLPVLGNLEYTIAVFRYTDDGIKIKAAFMINALLFTVFNIVIRNYIGAVMNIVVFVTTGISVWKYFIERKSAETEPGSGN